MLDSVSPDLLQFTYSAYFQTRAYTPVIIKIQVDSQGSELSESPRREAFQITSVSGPRSVRLRDGKRTRV